MALTGRELEELAAALVEAFPSYDDLSQLTQFKLDLNLAEVAPPEKLGAVVLALIEWARAEGKLHTLLEGARERNPDNRALATVAAALLPGLRDERAITRAAVSPPGFFTRHAAVLGATVGATLIAGLALTLGMATSHPEPAFSLTVSVTRIDFATGEPAEVLESWEYQGGGNVSTATLDRAAHTLGDWLVTAGILSPVGDVTVTITPPADLDRGPPVVTVDPPVKFEAYTIQIHGSKIIEPLAKADWERPQGEWAVQVKIDGHRLVTGDRQPVTAPQVLVSRRGPVSIGVEDQPGSRSPVAARLIQRLVHEPRIKVVTPSALAALREHLRRVPPPEDAHFTGQTTARESLGIQVLVTCSVQPG